MKKIYYWSPCLANIGTVKSTINSCLALSKYNQKKYEITLINACGEWNKYKNLLESKNIKILNLNFNYFGLLPKNGLILSRLSYILIFLISYYPLKNILKKNKPDFIIAHLITSLPIILNFYNNFKTKLILRISGYPKLVHAWDGIDLSTDTDISIDTGTRETITDTVIIEPNYDIPITDAENETVEMTVITVMPTPAGIDQIEVYDSETNESMELEMSNR